MALAAELRKVVDRFSRPCSPSPPYPFSALPLLLPRSILNRPITSSTSEPIQNPSARTICSTYTQQANASCTGTLTVTSRNSAIRINLLGQSSLFKGATWTNTTIPDSNGEAGGCCLCTTYSDIILYIYIYNLISWEIGRIFIFIKKNRVFLE